MRRFRIPALVGVAVVAAALLTWTLTSGAAPAPDDRLDVVESSVAGVAEASERLEAQMAELADKDEGLSGDLEELRAAVGNMTSALEGVRGDLAALRRDVNAANQAAGDLSSRLGSLERRLGSLNSTVISIDQRLWVLENKYNDHLRKYHSP